MIDRSSITQWAGRVPWNDPAQVEQDLIIDTHVFLRPERQFDPQAGYEMVRALLIDGLKQ